MVKNSLETYRICRTCFKQVKNESLHYSLEEEPNINPSLGQKLNNCVPELNLTVTPNAIVCSSCFRAINSSYEFKMLCQKSELQLQKHLQQLHSNIATLDLTEIVEADEINPKYFADVVIKQENVEDNSILQSISKQCTSKPHLPSTTGKTQLHYTSNKSSKKKAAGKEFHGKRSAIKIKTIYKCRMCAFVTKFKLHFCVHVRNHCTKNDYRHIITDNKNGSSQIKKKYGKVDKVHKTTENTITTSNNQKSIIRKDSMTNVANRPAVAYLNTAIKIQLGKSRSHTKTPSNKSKITNISQRNSGIVLKGKSFLCSSCDHKSKDKSNLKRHMKIHTGEKPFICNICNYRCTLKGTLKIHMATHSVHKPFRCTLCNFKTKYKASVEVHRKIHTEEGRFMCDICNYKCIHKSNLKKHMVIHSIQKLFNCRKCDFTTNHKISLQNHIEIHTGERRFICNICNNRYITKRDLRTHMVIHTIQKPFECNQCDFMTKYKPGLKRHMNVHNKEKLFSCDVCNSKFVQKRYLTQHMTTHVTEKPFKCSRCDFTTKHNRYLQEHIVKIHDKLKTSVKINPK